MAGKCGDCRWYDGKKCEIQPGSHSSISSCGLFVDHTGDGIDKKCKSCRWYDGHNCETQPGSHSPNSSCGKYSPFR